MTRMGSDVLEGDGPDVLAVPPVEPAPLLRRVAAVLTVLLVCGVLADSAGVLADLQQVGLLDRLIAGEDVPVDEIDDADSFYASVSLVQAVAFFATAVLFLIWFRRAYRNVDRVSSGVLRFGPGWAVGAWFVPFLNLWRPKQMANDIYRSGDPDPGRPVPFFQRPVSGWLHVWWAFWVVANVGGNGGLRGLLSAQTLDEQRTSAVVTAFADGTSVIAGLLAIYVVFTLTRRQDAVAR